MNKINVSGASTGFVLFTATNSKRLLVCVTSPSWMNNIQLIKNATRVAATSNENEYNKSLGAIFDVEPGDVIKISGTIAGGVSGNFDVECYYEYID